MSETITIKTVQFKRGSKAKLSERLVASDLGVLQAGEPAFETDTGQLKIGNGVSNYVDLPYVGADARFAIEDPLSGQILVYDAAAADGKGAWVNVNITAALPGYAEAENGMMLTKDGEHGIAWVDYTQTLNKKLQQADAKVQQANTYAQTAAGHSVQAGHYAEDSGASAIEAHSYVNDAAREATRAEYAVADIKDFIENKFWWGSIEEYNALSKIDPETFYFVRAEN